MKISSVGKLVLIILVLAMVLGSSCAAGQNHLLNNSREQDKEPAGFFLGLWHGVALPVMFIISLFNSDVNIYEVYNNGALYNLGFLFGVIIIFSGGGHGSARMRKE